MARITSTDQPIAQGDAALWADFLADPGAGMTALYDRYSRLVYGVARKILSDSQEAQDVTHEVFVSLLAKSAYDAGRGSIGTYLCTMTRSRAIDRLRGRARSRLALANYAQEEEGASFPPAAEEVLSGESAHAVREALRTLPDTERKVLELAYFQGLSQTQIASQLDAPLGTVKSWARNGLLRLRATLADFEGP